MINVILTELYLMHRPKPYCVQQTNRDMKDKIYWTMRNGHKINVDDMSESDLRNTLKMLIRDDEAFHLGCYDEKYPQI